MIVMKKIFNAVKMVGEIRDKSYVLTRRMTNKAIIDFYCEKSKAFHAKPARGKTAKAH